MLRQQPRRRNGLPFGIRLGAEISGGLRQLEAAVEERERVRVSDGRRPDVNVINRFFRRRH
jgi:hypothetical protein